MWNSKLTTAPTPFEITFRCVKGRFHSAWTFLPLPHLKSIIIGLSFTIEIDQHISYDYEMHGLNKDLETIRSVPVQVNNCLFIILQRKLNLHAFCALL